VHFLMKSMRLFAAASFCCLSLAICQRSSFAGSTTLIDNASNPDRAVITFPDYVVSPPGKWTIVILKEKSLRFRSLDRLQNMQAGVVDLHPKSKQTEDDALHSYVDNRRQLEHENIDNKALKADAISYFSDERGKVASWCIIDQAGKSAHLTAILESKRKLLVVSYDADNVTEAEFRDRAAMVTSTMKLR
jgi:hypothetical protein